MSAAWTASLPSPESSLLTGDVLHRSCAGTSLHNLVCVEKITSGREFELAVV
jgi:hypothetical protein